MQSGVVKWFNAEKGFGFIVPSEVADKRDVFFHYSAIVMEGFKTLQERQVVCCEAVETEKGMAASRVEPQAA